MSRTVWVERRGSRVGLWPACTGPGGPVTARAPRVRVVQRPRGRVIPIGFDRQCAALGLPVPIAEVRFCDLATVEDLAAIGLATRRRWRIDWAFVEARVALEVEGGYAAAGRHTRPSGFLEDQHKYNALVCLGWRLLRVTPRDVQTGDAVTWARRLLARLGAAGTAR